MELLSVTFCRELPQGGLGCSWLTHTSTRRPPDGLTVRPRCGGDMVLGAPSRPYAEPGRTPPFLSMRSESRHSIARSRIARSRRFSSLGLAITAAHASASRQAANLVRPE